MFLLVHLNNSNLFINNGTLQSMQKILLSEERNMTIKNKVRRYQQVSILVIFTLNILHPAATVNVIQSIWNFLMLYSTLVLVTPSENLRQSSNEKHLDFLCTHSKISSFAIHNCKYFNKLCQNSPAIKIPFLINTCKAVLITNGKFLALI